MSEREYLPTVVQGDVITISIPMVDTRRQRNSCTHTFGAKQSTHMRYSPTPLAYRAQHCACGAVRIYIL